jgi:predicted transcriptional regulator of viral defense system
MISRYPEGIDFKTIMKTTGFEDKKLRNIIYRLDSLGKIERVRRGSYKTT